MEGVEIMTTEMILLSWPRREFWGFLFVCLLFILKGSR